MKLHLYLQRLSITCITVWVLPPVISAVALDSHRNTTSSRCPLSPTTSQIGLSSCRTYLKEGKGAGDWVQPPRANDLTSLAYVMKPFHKTPKGLGSESFQVGEHWRCRERGAQRDQGRSSVPLPHNFFYESILLGSWAMSLYNKSVI